MARQFAVAALSIALAVGCVAPMADADHTYSPCGSSYVTIDAGAATLYYINDKTGMWVYLESNGHADLQRGGHAFWDVGTPEGDHCWDIVVATGEQHDPDLILF